MPLWSLALDDVGRASLRVVYSRELGCGFPDLTDSEHEQDEGSPFKFCRRSPGVNSGTFWPRHRYRAFLRYGGWTKSDLSTDARPPAGRKADVPRSGVVRPRDMPIKFLNDIDSARGFENKDSGIALVTPFEKAMLRMTALGATFEGIWKGQPARVFHSLEADEAAAKGSLPPGFDLQRLQINTWLGRDIEVVAVEKGFLFPLGMPASLGNHSRKAYFSKEMAARVNAVSPAVHQLLG